MTAIVNLLGIDVQAGFSDTPQWGPLIRPYLSKHFPQLALDDAAAVRFAEDLFADKLLLPGLNELGVPGAWDDMTRAGVMIDRIGGKISSIMCTLDSHRTIHIAQSCYWRNSAGEMPPPFTFITHRDVVAGVWTPRNPAWRGHALKYTAELERVGKYLLIIWTPHCEIGTPGHNVHPMLRPALRRWELKYLAAVDYLTKGVAFGYEHYGALLAEVIDPADPSTMLDAGLVKYFDECDILAIYGEALSHCVLATVNQIAEALGRQHIKKFVLLRDATSPVPAVPNGPDFPAIAEAWVSAMQNEGMTVTTTTEFLT